MKEFQSQLEQLLATEELLFNATPGFGRYKPFLEQSIAHPAKMNTRLTEYLIRTLTKENDVILDPMSGSGQTGVIAALLGRNAVCVELEEKFYKWQLEAKIKLETSQTLSAKGKMACVLGDARKLGELLTATDAIVTSPPYSDQNARTRKPDNTRNICGRGNIGLPYDAVVTSPPYSGSVTGSDTKPERRAERMIAAGHDPKTLLGGKARVAIIEWRYAERENKENIGNLSHGEIDAVITSPPYSDSKKQPSNIDLEHEVSSMETDTRPDTKNRRTPGRIRAIEALVSGYGDSEGNIGNLPLGQIDAVITSPPYGEAQQGSGIAKRGYQGDKHSPTDLVGQRSYMPDKFESEGNISKLKHGEIDAVITSPPYADGTKGPSRSPLFERLAQDPTSNRYGRKSHPTTGEGYGTSKENIGNLPNGDIDAIITSPPYSEGIGHKAGENASPDHKERLDMQRKYTEQMTSEGNIGSLKHGEIDAIVTSPPYAEVSHHSDNPKELEHLRPGRKGRVAGKAGIDKNNIGHLPFVDAVVTSPPYSEGLGHGRGKSTELQETKKLHLHGAGSYAENADNIGEIRTHGEIDAVITSPPYHDAKSDWDRTSNAAQEGESVAYSDEVGKSSRGNIGNIHYYDDREPLSHKYSRANGKETYLAAMLKVYEEMWKVLKEDGLAIIVVKPFIRNKKVVDLPYQTWLLMQKCGFKLTKLFKLRLTQQSFWRILYQKKHPEVDVIAHEYVLVCRK